MASEVPLDVESIRARAEEAKRLNVLATPGPWCDGGEFGPLGLYLDTPEERKKPGWSLPLSRFNRQFIAAARTSYPQLADDVTALLECIAAVAKERDEARALVCTGVGMMRHDRCKMSVLEFDNTALRKRVEELEAACSECLSEADMASLRAALLADQPKETP